MKLTYAYLASLLFLAPQDSGKDLQGRNDAVG